MKALVAALVVLLSAPAGAQSVDDLIRAARASDPEYRRLQVMQERLELQYRRADHSPALSLTLGSATAGSVSLRTAGGVEPGGDPDRAVSLQVVPRASLGLGDSHSVNLQATVESGADDLQVTPSVNYGWNPGPIGQTSADRLQELERTDARLASAEALATREHVIGNLVRAALRNLTQAQRQRDQAASALETARDALSDADTLGSPSPQSADYRELQLELAQATRSLQLRELALDDALRDLEQLTGISVDGGFPPLLLTTGMPALAEVPESGLNSHTHLAALRSVELAEARLTEEADENGATPPSLSASARWSRSPGTELSGPRQQLGAGVGLLWERFTLGLDTDLALGGGDVPTTTRLTVQWQLPDRRADSLDLALESASTELAELSYAQVLRQLRDEREGLLSERRVLEDAIARHSEDAELLDLRIAEATRRVERGLAATELLETLEEQRELMEYDRVLLQLDIMNYNAEASRLAGEEGSE